MIEVIKKLWGGLLLQSPKPLLASVVEASDANPMGARALKKITSSQFFPSTPQDVQDRETASHRDAVNGQFNPVEVASNPAIGAATGQGGPDKPELTVKEDQAVEVRYCNFQHRDYF
jgi:hypothetical protein